jgi:hypothetical protein
VTTKAETVMPVGHKKLNARGKPRKSGPKGGRPRKHFPTAASRRQVIELRIECKSLGEIATELGTTVDTIKHNYKAELAAALCEMLDRTEMRMFKSAMAGLPIASTIFVLKAKRGWYEASAETARPPPAQAPSIRVTFTVPPPRDAQGRILDIGGAEISLEEWRAKYLNGGRPH